MTDPYAHGMINYNPYAKKKIVTARVVAVLRGTMDKRGLSLIAPKSRALKRSEIHEIIVTDEKQAGPGKQVNHIGYIAFVEIIEGGVVVTGDFVRVSTNNSKIGTVVGFDETHMPNHQNIVIFSEKITTGEDMNIGLNDLVLFWRED